MKRFDNNKWALPGGQIEISESVVDTVKREIHEETGLDVSVESVIGVYSNPRHIIAYSDGETRRQFFILCKAVLIGGTIHTDSETSAAAFFSKEEALTLDLSPTQRQRIEDAYAAEIGGVVR